MDDASIISGLSTHSLFTASTRNWLPYWIPMITREHSAMRRPSLENSFLYAFVSMF